MPTYITLYNWTANGIENIDDSSDRYDDAVDLAASLDGEITDAYVTLGRFDVVFVSEFPDDETYATFALRLASKGYVRGETLKAFPESAFREIMAALPE